VIIKARDLKTGDTVVAPHGGDGTWKILDMPVHQGRVIDAQLETLGWWSWQPDDDVSILARRS